MRKVTTEFSCDRCGRKVKTSKELQRFSVVQIRRGSKWNGAVHADFCEDCESEFLAAIEPFTPGDQLADLHAMSRSED